MIRYVSQRIRNVFDDRDGQSMVFIAIILFTLVCFIAITINVGVFVSDKIHTQGLADAAAVSGAVWQARGLNIIKLLNQMINVSILHVAAEMAQQLYWDLMCVECIAEREWFSFTCWLPTEPCWNAIVELDDLRNEQDAIKEQIDTMFAIQKLIGEHAVPLTAIASIEYNFFSMNDADFMAPWLNFVAGSGDFTDSTTGGWMYYVYPTLALHEEDSSLWAEAILWSRYSQCRLAYDKDYPDKQWIATIGRYEYRPEIMFDTEYNPDGYGHWALAQARPFNDDPDLGIGLFDVLEACNWDVKLMPFTADNQLAAKLGTVPSWLITAASDLFILH